MCYTVRGKLCAVLCAPLMYRADQSRSCAQTLPWLSTCLPRGPALVTSGTVWQPGSAANMISGILAPWDQIYSAIFTVFSEL